MCRPETTVGQFCDVAELGNRWRSARAFVVVGVLCVVSGGIVAAVSGPTDFDVGSWLAAYLVLVGGVAQIGLGAGQSCLSADVPPARLVNVEFVSWNAALGAVVLGTLAAAPVLTTVGAMATAGVLIAFLYGTRRVRRSVGRAVIAYRGLVVFILLSAPVGLVLAWVRHG